MADTKKSINPLKGFATPVEFAQFDKRAFAYVKPVRSDDMRATFPEAANLPVGVDLWGLFAADGEPIALADEPGALVQNAGDLQLMTLALH